MPPEVMESLVDEASNAASGAYEQALGNGSDISEAIESAINAASSAMVEMGVPTEMVESIGSSIIDEFNEAISNGASLEEALEIALDGISDVSNSDLNTEDQDISPEYNFDFAHSLDSPGAKLLDEAMAKGLTVEEALKYVNKEMFPEGEGIQQGPPTLAEIQELNSEKINVVKQEPEEEEENELSQMEADMDAEAGNVVEEKPEDFDESQKLGTEELSNDIKDDDIS